MRKLIILSVFALIVGSCGQATKKQTKETNSKTVSERGENNTIVEREAVFDSDELQFPLIGNTIGFISFDFDKWYSEGDDTLNKIEILNEDSSIWLSADVQDFVEYTNSELNIRKNNNIDFQPWAFEPSIGVFTIRCIAKTENAYTIIVDEEKNIVKQLQKHEQFQFQTLEEHVSMVLVSTDFSLNPIREKPNENAAIVNTIDDEIDLTASVELKGDWIKIENSYSNKVLGWIRWKKGDRFMVWLYYSV